MKNILSFNQFESVYESDQSGATSEAPKIIDKKNGVPSDDISSIIDFLEDLDKEGKEVKESNIYEQKASNPFIPVVYGEKSDRVKLIQKYLGLTEDGSFGPQTKKAVEDFQKKNDLKIDGKVGEQTYGKMLELKMNIKDPVKKEEKIEDFKSMEARTKKIVDSIVKDPRFHEIFESITIVVVDGQTRVICIPKKDAKEKVEALKKDKMLTSNYLWVEKVADAIGKAVAFTLKAAIIIPIEVAKAMISGAISASKFVAKGALSVISTSFYGIAQIGRWISSKGSQIYNTLKTEGQQLFRSFCEAFSRACKNSKEAIIAFAGAVSSALKKSGELFANIAYIALGAAAATAGLAWKSAKNLAQAVKQGMEDLAKKGEETAKKLKKGIEDGYAEAKKNLVDTGNKLAAGAKSLGKGALDAIGKGIEYAGNQTEEFGKWLQESLESLYLETGNPVFESLIY